MNKKKIIYVIIAIFTFVIITTGVLLAAPNIQLSVTTSGDTATLTWTNSDTVDVYSYSIKRNKKSEGYKEVYNAASKPVRVLNVYPGTGETISFNTYDGERISIPKSGSLKRWMEEATGMDSHGYGRGLIEVTPVTFDAFNANPTQYLNKNSGEYNQDVIFFGTWDENGKKDLTLASSQLVEEFINAGKGVIFGHDTIANISNSDALNHPNFVRLAKYVNIVPGTSWTSNHDTRVKISRNGVFTKYPWNIGDEGTVLTIPTTHDLGQTANGDIWMTFDNNTLTGGQNFYLTTYRNCAMIQTGHSNCEATSDEQKILANLIFYLADLDDELKFEDKDFKDVDAPNAPIIQNKTLNGVNGQVSYTATDNGTTYSYYVEALEKVSQQVTTSNTVTKERKTEVQKYRYVIDNKNNTVPTSSDTTITSTSLNYTLTDGPETWLHIQAIDGAGNVGPVTHVLLHTNVPPEMELSQNPTKWTNQNVTITATATDEDGRVVSIKTPEGTVVDGDNTTYIVTKNGIYEFVATDNSGATVTKSIEITNIDKVNPEGTFEIAQPTKDVRSAVITFTATDEASGVAKIVLPDNSEVTESNEEVLSKQVTYNVTEPGNYMFIIYDVAGNVKIVWVDVVIKSDGVVVRHIDNLHKENEISPEVSLTGNVGETYTTQAETIPGYRLVVTPDNANGNYTMDEQVVTYEYKHEARIVVKYVDLVNGNATITDNEDLVLLEGDVYNSFAKSVDDYTLVTQPDETEVTVGREDIELVYGYKKNTSGIDVKYIDQVTKMEIANTVHYDGLEKDPYTAKPQEIAGYRLITPLTEIKGVLEVSNEPIVYEYRKLSKLIVHHVDLNGNREIIDPVEKDYAEGEEYTSLPQDFAGYVLFESPDEETGVMGRENVEKTYKYKKISAGLVVKYIDRITNEVMKTLEYSGNELDEIKLQDLSFENYVMDEQPDVNSVKLTVEAQEYRYYYKRIINIYLLGIDENSGERIYRKPLSGIEGDKYTTTASEVEGYTLDSSKLPDNASGEYSRNGKDVVYYYTKNSKGVLVKYIDIDTNEVLKEYTISGAVGDKYDTQKEEYEKYNFVRVDGNPSGTMVEDLTTVNYYYQKKVGKVVVVYEDREGNELYKEELSGKVDEAFKLEEKKIENYRIVERPESTEGTYKLEEQVFKFIVEKIPGKITVQIVDEDGNIIGEETAEGYVGEEAEIELPDIDGYYNDGDKAVKAEYKEGETIIQVEYKKMPELPETGDINVILMLIIAIASTTCITLRFNKN